MAKRLDKFSKPFRDSRIPFMLAEVITNGEGEMVDLVCQFTNGAAAALLGLPAEELHRRRFTHVFPAAALQALEPLRDVAFSGSAASFSYTTALNRKIKVTCYQPQYGVAACVLELMRENSSREHTRFLAENLPGAVLSLELSRAGVRCLSFPPGLCTLTGWSRRELLDRCADLDVLVEPEDRPELLQALLDAAREDRQTAHSFRLLRRDQDPLWVELRAEVQARREGAASFYAILLDAQRTHQTQTRLEEAQGQLADAQEELDLLFDGLDAALCLFRRDTPEGPVLPVRLGRGLSQLLGYPLPELGRRLAANPLWRVLPADRETLLAAVEQARAAERPLHHICRLRAKGGRLLWAALDVAWHSRGDGAGLIYAACFDITQEREASEEVRFRAQLCELMLDQSRMLSFDYDPIEDVARTKRHDGASRQVQHVAQQYLASGESEEVIHPEDRGRRAAMIKRLLARPGTETLEYRADYDGQGWRWCRISWVSLMDNMGGVCRLLGKAEDVTQSKICALRFQALAARQKKLAPGVLTVIRLDLSADRIKDAKASSRYLSGVLFGNTADACLRHLRDNVPDENQRREFDEKFRRQPLLDALRGGTVYVELEHRFSLGGGRGSAWVRTAVELAEDPETLAFTAFCTITDISGHRRREGLLKALIQRDYDFVLTVDAATGLCRVYSKDTPRDAVPYRTVAAQYLGSQAPSRKRSAFRQAARLQTALERLETQEVYEYTGSLGADVPQEKRMRWSWLDREENLLLVTLESV